MNAEITTERLTVDEFLAWADDRPSRFELERGQVLAMSPDCVHHAKAKGVAYRALSTASQAIGTRDPPGLTLDVAELLA